jgi:hypothetical protein
VVWSLPFNAGANRDPEVWSSGKVHNATLYHSLGLTSDLEFATDYIREDLIRNLVSVLASKRSWPHSLCPSTFIARFPLFRHTKQKNTLFGSCVPIVMILNNKRVRHWHSSFVLVRSFLPPNRHLKHSEHGSSAAQIQFTTHTDSSLDATSPLIHRPSCNSFWVIVFITTMSKLGDSCYCWVPSPLQDECKRYNGSIESRKPAQTVAHSLDI